MARGRRRKGPWLRKSDNAWYTNKPGDQRPHRLTEPGADYQKAWDEFVKFHSQFGSELVTRITIAELRARFVNWSKVNRAARTTEWYEQHLPEFVEHVGSSTLADDICPYHVDDWIGARYATSSANYRRNAMRAVERLFRWATDKRLIDHNPIGRLEKPPQEASEFVIDWPTVEKMIDIAPPDFIDYLQFMIWTGCRPQEIRQLTAGMFQDNPPRLVIPTKSAKGKRRPRVIYLPTNATEMIRQKIADHEFEMSVRKRFGFPVEVCLFLNSKGRPWNRSSVRGRMNRLRDKLGLEKLTATALRHSWATHVLKSGKVDTTTASVLMGHADPSTCARNYQHIIQDHEFLSEAAQRALE